VVAGSNPVAPTILYGVSMADLIVVDPEVMLGKPVVAGTRITVEHILEQLGHGHSVDELLAGHARLTREGVGTAIQYAIDAVRAERVVTAAGR
jgi:uncharacterized protein (DUF433 family)